MVTVVAVFLLALLLLGAYGLFLEPNWVQLETLDVTVPGAPTGLHNLKIVYLVDLHIRKLGWREKRAIELANALEPHVALIGGDLAETKDQFQLALQFLDQLQAPLGKYAVLGNWEVYLNFRMHWLAAQLAQVGVTLLVNDHKIVKVPGATIKIAGVDEVVLGRPDLDQALGGSAPADFTVLLAHEPVILDRIGQRRVDLVLAGHSHGGQVSLPWIRPAWLPRGVGNYIKGDFRRGNTIMHVSRGLGTSAIPVRIGCPPEVTLVRLVRSAE